MSNASSVPLGRARRGDFSVAEQVVRIQREAIDAQQLQGKKLGAAAACTDSDPFATEAAQSSVIDGRPGEDPHRLGKRLPSWFRSVEFGALRMPP